MAPMLELFLKAACLTVVALSAGCGSTPYVDVGVGYKNPDDTWPDWGSNPTTSIEVGTEWIDHNAWCGYRHQSHLLDGKPFNDNRETHIGTVECHKRWYYGGNK